MNQIKEIAEELFGNEHVIYEKYDEGSISIRINPLVDMKKDYYRVDEVDISSDKIGFIYMDIDSYHWEFDDNYDEAVKEIQKYLIAAQESRLVKERSWLIFNKLCIR